MKYKNNPKNKKSLLDYQKRILELSQRTQDEARKRRIMANVEKWEENLSGDMKRAIPKNLPETVIEKIKKTPLSPPYEKYLVVSGKDVLTTRFTSYAIIYALIKKGLVTPSEVKKTDILDAYNNVNGMFQSRRWKDYFFNDSAKVLLIEGSTKALALLGSKGEDQFWREILEFTRNSDKLVIITYSPEDEEIEKGLFIPSLTSDKQLNYRLIKKSLFINLNKKEEEEIKIEKAKTN